MKKHLWKTSFILILVSTSTVVPSGGGENAKDIFRKYWRQGNTAFEVEQFFETQIWESFLSQQIQIQGKKSVGKAVLFSAVVPGSGQFYAGSKLKGIAFLVIEAAALTGYFHFQSKGNDLEDQFEGDADQLWDEDSYWNWIAQISGIPRSDMDDLRDFEHANFSHFLPENKNQQYYENIGKYNQFVIGWQDFREGIVDTAPFTFAHYQSGKFSGQELLTISEQRNAYTELRKDANDNFKRATNLVTVTFFNHVLSALDAGLTTKRLNRRLEGSLRIRGMLYQKQIIPVLKLGVAW